MQIVSIGQIVATVEAHTETKSFNEKLTEFVEKCLTCLYQVNVLSKTGWRGGDVGATW